MTIPVASERNPLADYALTLRWRWPYVVVPLLLALAAATYLATQRVASYDATARVLLVQSAAEEAVTGFGVVNSGVRDRLLANEVSLAESDQVKEVVRTKLGLPADEDPPTGQIVGSAGSDVLEFTFSADEPERAAELANTWAQSYVEVRREAALASIDGVLADLEARVDDLQARRLELRSTLDALLDRQARTTDPGLQQTLDAQIDVEAAAIAGEVVAIDAQVQASIDDINQLSLTRELGSDAARVVRAAAPDSTGSAGILLRNLAIGGVLGAMLGIGLALVVDNVSRTIRIAADVERLGLDVIGVLPKGSKRRLGSQLDTVAVSAPNSPLANEFQRIRSTLQVAITQQNIRTVLIASGQYGEGKTFVAANLGLVFATVNDRVDLVDLDLRQPRIHSIFGRSQTPGLTDVAIKDAELGETLTKVTGMPELLRVLPAGTSPPNPAPFVSTQPFADVVARLQTSADLVIFDSPPALLFADALAVSSQVDAVILVVQAGTTSPDNLTLARDSITRSGGQLLGVILNGQKSSRRTRKPRR